MISLAQDQYLDFMSEVSQRNTVLAALAEVFPEFSGVSDSRIWNCALHINDAFSTDPQFVMTTKPSELNPQMLVVPALYVFPSYRRRGVGLSALREIQKMTRELPIVLEGSVEEYRDGTAGALMLAAGFTRCPPRPDGAGRMFVNYYWSGSPFEIDFDKLTREPVVTLKWENVSAKSAATKH